jgi:hypothetical protein
MATTEERMRILRMIQEGKISAEEGAKLLAALRESRKEPRPVSGAVFAGSRGGKGMLRVRVTDMVTGKSKVNVKFAPSVDFDQIADAIRSGQMEGKIVDVVDEEDGEHIEVFID